MSVSSYVFVIVLGAFRILARNSLRAGLTMLGIVVGVGSVITIVSIAQGARFSIQAHVATEGLNIIYILPGAHTLGGVRSGLGSMVTLTMQDAQELKANLPLLLDTCWSRRDPTQVIYGNQNWQTGIFAISPSCLAIKNWSFVGGGPITQTDMDSAATVAVLGQTVVENLFQADEEPTGSTIRIKNVPFRVIGVLAPKGRAPGGYDQDDIIFIPFSTAQRKVQGARAVETIAASTHRREDLPEAAEQIREVLRTRHRLQPEQPDDFVIRTQLEIEKLYEGASQTLTVFLLVVASISLFIGGIGIMNILLVSVTERTREIGVRMAVGAKRRHILIQFLIEAMTLSLVGGVVGIGFGILGARVTTVVAGWPTIISPESILAAFLFSLAIGLFFGLYPANKAARLNPIEALRYE